MSCLPADTAERLADVRPTEVLPPRLPDAVSQPVFGGLDAAEVYGDLIQFGGEGRVDVGHGVKVTLTGLSVKVGLTTQPAALRGETP